MGNQKSTLGFKARLEIHEKLKGVIIPTGPDLCTYAEGWSDNRVAQELGCAPSNVKGVRAEVFGKLRQAAGGPRSGDVEERLTQIEDFLTSKWPDWKDHLDPDLFSKGGK